MELLNFTFLLFVIQFSNINCSYEHHHFKDVGLKPVTRPNEEGMFKKFDFIIVNLGIKLPDNIHLCGKSFVISQSVR